MEGRTFRGQLLTLGVLAVPSSGRARIGFVTSKRIGGAVIRNRIRRRLREIYRSHQHDLRGDAWIVVVARPAAASASYRVLADEWCALARRALVLAP